MRDGAAPGALDGPLVRTFCNLVGVPSRHYDGIYGRAVHEVIERARPDAVALELPPALLPELPWAEACWPGPVASFGDGQVMPFVPGDSIFEAYRLAQQTGIPVHLVDLEVEADEVPSVVPVPLPGTELARRAGEPFFEVLAGLLRESPPTSCDLAREAAMARALAGLMTRHRLVLWVGGLAHWERIVGRLESGDFDGPALPVRATAAFQRARLAPSALHRLTGQWPWMVRRFALSPRAFDPVEAMPKLLHEATHPRLDRRILPPESPSPVNLARAGIYARNLAATRGLAELPTLADLLLAAKDVLDDRYAARLYLAAMAEHTSRASRSVSPLTWRVDSPKARAGFRFRRRWVTLEPWLPPERPLLELPHPAALRRAARDAHYEALPGPRAGDAFHWRAYPPDESEYEAFVEHVLARASVTDPEEARSLPFTSGLVDGIDVRTTIRRWSEDTVYVREERRGPARVTNGVIDWVNAEEGTDMLQGRVPGCGWNDPDCLHVGSCSREVEPSTLLFRRGGAEAAVRHRAWSLISLDCPTSCGRTEARRTFFDLVIDRLVAIQGWPTKDDVYGWMEVMCRFCAGKPLAYFSLYRPGPRLIAVARAHDVRLLWSPLASIPSRSLNRHRTFRQMHLADSQWEELQARLAEAGAGPRGFRPPDHAGPAAPELAPRTASSPGPARPARPGGAALDERDSALVAALG